MTGSYSSLYDYIPLLLPPQSPQPSPPSSPASPSQRAPLTPSPAPPRGSPSPSSRGHEGVWFSPPRAASPLSRVVSSEAMLECTHVLPPTLQAVIAGTPLSTSTVSVCVCVCVSVTCATRVGTIIWRSRF